ncbi:MAG TPA: glycosyltransferase family A protein [Polyangia bacterium]|jgi:GT2 family glycosyltransferase|nr:glycosyltransferase family A protein [Polyangia bacterium]
MTFFSVVIPTCDRPDMLASCLDSLEPARQLCPVPFEVIVTDDGQRPVASLVETKYPWAKWTQGPRRGPASNRNHGARLAIGRWLVFIDDDCTADADCLASYDRAIRANPACRAIEGAIHADGDCSGDLEECPVNTEGGLFWSANICVERAFFHEAGAFDEAYRLAAHEDQDLFCRLKARTCIPFASDARVTHPVRTMRLGKMIADTPKRNEAWIYFAVKNAASLNYATKADILRAAYMAHLRGGVREAARRHPKKLTYHALMLLAGVPLQVLVLASAPPLAKTSSV